MDLGECKNPWCVSKPHAVSYSICGHCSVPSYRHFNVGVGNGAIEWDVCPHVSTCRFAKYDRKEEQKMRNVSIGPTNTAVIDMQELRPDMSNALEGVDMVNHPPHYTSSPAVCSGCGKGIECIDVVRHMNFSRGNCVKYIWRAGSKDDELQDLRKAQFYLNDEIARLEKEYADKGSGK